jgi:hypothetical protein
MKDHWLTDATDEEHSLRVFKDALIKYSVEKPWSFLSSEQERTAELAASEVENAYARVREHTHGTRGEQCPDLRGGSHHAQEGEGQQGVRKGAAVSQDAGTPRLLLLQGYVWIRACLRHAASHGRGACS